MVQIGYEINIAQNNVTPLFNKYKIRQLENRFLYNQMCFVEVETENILKRGLCSWGGGDNIKQINRIITKLSNREQQDMLIDAKNSIILDNDFWLSFVSDFVSEFKKVGLRRYYNDVTVDNGVLYISLQDLTANDLLQMDVNQSIIISNKNQD